MKIVCGSCGAKYSIADEKVQGKVFKIRCKKCSNVIVVKGNEGAEEAIADSGGDAAEWYVVIDGDQAGPVSSVEIDSYFMSGRINAETFAWRDGLADWAPVASLPEFAHLRAETAGPEEATQISTGYTGMSAALAAPEEDETVNMSAFDPASLSGGAAEHDPSADVTTGFTAGGFDSGAEAGGFGSDLGFDSGADSGGGMFGDSGADSGGGFSDFGAAPAADAGAFSSFDSPSDAFGSSGGGAALESAASGDAGGMFASFDSNSTANEDFLGFGDSEVAPVNGGVEAPSVGSPNLTGTRNENSVLFSLSSLDSVQAVTGPSSAVPGGPITAADAATTEGSGLIDIRALASAHQNMKGTGAGGDDNLDPFSAGSMAMPALMPMGSHRSNKPLIIGGIVAAVLLLGIVGVALGVLLTREEQEPLVQKVFIPPPPSVEPVEVKDNAAEEQLAAMKAERDALLKAAEPEKAGSDEIEKVEDTPEKKAKSGSTKSTKRPPKKTRPKKKGDAISNILDNIDDGKKAESSAPAPKPKKKTTKSGLSKSEVGGTIKRYSGRVNTCYKKQNKNGLSGTLKVKFAIKPNGKVTNAQIKTGKFAGTDVGKCVVKAVKGMKFPTFDGSNIPVTYPFKLK